MQTTQTKNTNTNTNVDTKEGLTRIDELMAEVNSGGDYFKMSDGETQKVQFNLRDTPGMRTRILSLPNEATI